MAFLPLSIASKKYIAGATVAFVLLGIAAPARAGTSRAEIGRELKHDVSPPLLNMVPPATADEFDVASRELVEEQKGENAPAVRFRNGGNARGSRRSGIRAPNDSPNISFNALVMPSSVMAAASSGMNFDGISANNGWAVPDTNGAAGATQFVEWVNSQFAVFDKATGNIVYGPVNGNTLWSGFGGPCETNNNGDPIAQYDKAASRWVLTQHAVQSGGPYYQCVAVSTTSDATGSYNRYAFQLTTLFPDYPKLAVWPDAYYVSTNLQTSTFGNGGATVCALDRNAMLNGTAATSVCFTLSSATTSLLPSDWDGSIAPPAGSPNYLLNLGMNALNLWKFHVDFQTPANSTLTGPASISVNAFSRACNGGVCVPQAGTTQTLDSLGDRLMYRLPYRHFADGHESMVITHSVGNPAGIRWYEIRDPGGTPAVFQEGTFSPDTNWRWMGSIAMDQAGDIAVGYSESSSSMSPALYYTGRLSSDAPGTMQAENLILQGTGSEIGSQRWGDYSSMIIDPADDCTFWYTGEYLSTNGSLNWKTRIASFSFSSCTNPGPTSVSPTSLSFAAQVVGTTSVGQNVLLTNKQTVMLNIGGIVTTGDFAQSNNCGSSLNPGAGCTITVTFTPTTAGLRSGTLTITTDASNSPQSVNLSGTGLAPSASFSPTSLTFGKQAIGTTSGAKKVTLTNSGTAALTVNSVTASGDFGETDTCSGVIVQPGKTCVINVTFTPSVTGVIPGAVTVNDSAANSPQVIKLTGTGATPIASSPASLTFGNVTVGTTSATQTVTLTNTTTAALNFTVNPSGNYSVFPSGTSPCGSTLGSQAQCTFSVTFTPTANGNIRGAVTIASNAALSPTVVGLIGTGVNGSTGPLTFSVSIVNFSGVIAGTTGAAKTVSVTNSSTATVNISSIIASGDYATSAVSNSCGGGLAPAAKCNVAVSFSPIIAGTVYGSIAFSDDAAVSPQILGLSGTSILPLTLSPSAITFSAQTVGTASATQKIALSNNQSTVLTINGISVSGDYLLTNAGINPCGAALAAHTQCNIGVSFQPTTAGTIAGAVTIAHSAATSPQMVGLTGTGQ